MFFKCVEFTLAFRNYVRWSERKEITFYEYFPRTSCSINVINHLSPFCSFSKEPQIKLKVTLTFQYFIFLRFIRRWVHCKYYFTSVFLKISCLLWRLWKWSKSICWNWSALYCGRKRHCFIYSHHLTPIYYFQSPGKHRNLSYKFNIGESMY